MPDIRITIIILITFFFTACSNTQTYQDQASTHSDTKQSYQTLPEAQPDQDTVESTHDSLTEHTRPPGDIAEEPVYSEIWHRIQDQLTLDRNLTKKSVNDRLKWYARNQEYLDRVAERATPYLYHIVETVEKRGLPIELALLPIVESAYNPFAYSPSHASGIWQFIPGTGRLYGLKQNWWYDGRRDIWAATNAALDYLEKLHREFHGDWLLALAAYNTGEKNVARAINRNKKAGKPTDFWSLRLHRETRGYVPSLLAVAEIVANPGKYNISLKPITNRRYFARVNTESQIDLATVAELTGLSMDEIYNLNPAINRWATDPEGPHYLLLPVNKEDIFKQNLAILPVDSRIKWQQHHIKNGDTLGGIANTYHTDVRTLKAINNLRGNLIRTGHSLLIPVARQPLKNYTMSLDSRKFRGLKRTNDGEKYLYTIRRGDTLWDIGRNYGVSIKQLCSWNNITPGHILRPGKQLAVRVSQDTAKDNFIAVASHNINSKQQLVNYTVRKGDSLWEISRKFGVSVRQLQVWNNLNKKTRLHPGQNLDIYIGKPPADA